ncbi:MULTISPECIES: PLP-dependent aminotransferase family protein [Chryseobacterium]|jgi:DNA-binding transcriptional MocR family regulator|uniref:PLP-dependent aminotransferase family protein n=2 Tax=Chryseobacterium TaxID=59732 RepID=A0ABX9IRM7_9FLAO|nr:MULTISPECIES: PLP-dependent aminotransferase family protein [Chryseobacterium]MDR6546145.1 DNA-binding transcriptional MocR family regulator [Chryseobacterium rhizosphaerae]REC77829.1 PLP-dependent aminotransferase family protein [Chryseobacterium rhizosphaerae]GEN67117.1 GntR family transcriptional regulator [Chryseobacterium rhizosphaerae]SMC91055.1 DNA-binding transcriptional regulator, MocR family, contains an aminotransferase domain [Chryseobacterium sp. YR221]
MSKDVLYLKIANAVTEQIKTETLQFGDRLPSLRSAQKLHNVSLNTVKQAYMELESRSLVESRPKYGYYVSQTSQRKLALPSVAKIKVSQGQKTPEDLIGKVFGTIAGTDVTQFALGIPGKSLLPVAKMKKCMINVMKKSSDSGTNYEPVQGSENLRREIAKWAMVMEGKITEDDLVITSGAMNGVYNCLMAVTQPGDSVAIESPVYFGILQAIHLLGLKAVEIPTHPITGVDLDALKKVLPKISACCFVVNYNNPLGFQMPDENKKELVRMLTEYNVPLVEDDVYGNIYFGAGRPKPCKFYDEAGIVMWVGSVSKTLAPGYRVGWVAAGKFKDKIIRQKLVQTVSSPSLFSDVIADFLEHGRYDHHLRMFRKKLYANYLQIQKSVTQYFPDNTKISEPKGGFMLWLELDQRICTEDLYDEALSQKINFAPGRMFSQYNQYQNCMRLNYALEWTDRVESDLEKLGKMIKNKI